MKNWKSESDAREKIKELVAEYFHDFKEKRRYLNQERGLRMHLVYLMKKKCKV